MQVSLRWEHKILTRTRTDWTYDKKQGTAVLARRSLLAPSLQKGWDPTHQPLERTPAPPGREVGEPGSHLSGFQRLSSSQSEGGEPYGLKS